MKHSQTTHGTQTTLKYRDRLLTKGRGRGFTTIPANTSAIMFQRGSGQNSWEAIQLTTRLLKHTSVVILTVNFSMAVADSQRGCAHTPDM